MTAASSGTGRGSAPVLRGDPYLESDRLAALQQTGLLDTEPEPELDTGVALATRIFSAPMASMTLIDDRRQSFKSKIGLSVDGARATFRSTPSPSNRTRPCWSTTPGSTPASPTGRRSGPGRCFPMPAGRERAAGARKRLGVGRAGAVRAGAVRACRRRR